MDPGARDTRSESFSMEGCEFSLGGASDRLVFVRYSSRPEWSFYTSDRGILNNPLLQNVPSIALQCVGLIMQWLLLYWWQL